MLVRGLSPPRGIPPRGAQALAPTPLSYYNFKSPNGVRFQMRISLERCCNIGFQMRRCWIPSDRGRFQIRISLERCCNIGFQMRRCWSPSDHRRFQIPISPPYQCLSTPGPKKTRYYFRVALVLLGRTARRKVCMSLLSLEIKGWLGFTRARGLPSL